METMINTRRMLHRLDDAELRAVTGGVLTGRSMLTQMRQSLSPLEAIMATIPPPVVIAPAPAQPAPATPAAETTSATEAPADSNPPATQGTSSGHAPAANLPSEAKIERVRALNDEIADHHRVLVQLRGALGDNAAFAVADLGTTTTSDGETLAISTWLSSHGFGVTEMKDGVVTFQEFGSISAGIMQQITVLTDAVRAA